MTFRERAQQALEGPPTHTELVLRLHAGIKTAMASGLSREHIAADLEHLRSMNPPHEDAILDALDFLEGWSSSHMALR